MVFAGLVGECRQLGHITNQQQKSGSRVSSGSIVIFVLDETFD